MRERCARVIPAVMLALVALAAVALPASAQTVGRFGGHVALGYSHLFITDSPGGSLSVSGGVDYPLTTSLRLGGDVGFALLGSRVLEQEEQIANLDYSMFETSLLLHWVPQGLGPIGRVSFGPSLVSARAELATAGGGIEFTPYAVEEIAPGFSFSATLLKSSSRSPVRAGVEFGANTVFLENDTWTVANARLAIHY